MPKWTVDDIPDQSGRVALVTGATNGIGFATAMELARHGAHVILHGRDGGRGQDAVERIRTAVPNASLELRIADLGDLGAVKAMASQIRAAHPALDLLINNAGTMMAVARPTTQGHEQHLGVNYLSHFVLTLEVLDSMKRQSGARVVNVSSIAHRHWRIDPGNLSGRGLPPYLLYARSKLALTYFGLELDRRLRAARDPAISVLAHPGFAGTNLAQGMAPGLTRLWMTFIFPRFGQSLVDGARPTLYAATAPDVGGGEFYGPDGVGELKGAPKRVRVVRHATDAAIARRLWETAEQLTGVSLER